MVLESKVQFYKFHVGHFLKFKIVFFNSHYFYFSDKKYFSYFGIRNFRISTNDPDEICEAQHTDSIAENRINLTWKLNEINGFENLQKNVVYYEITSFLCVKSKIAHEQQWFKISTSMCMPSLRTIYENLTLTGAPTT